MLFKKPTEYFNYSSKIPPFTENLPRLLHGNATEAFQEVHSKRLLKFLEKRLKCWSDGDIDLIYKECDAIQQELPKSKTRQSDINKVSAKLVLEGSVRTAMNLIEQEAFKGVLQPNENVLKELQKLHPPRRVKTSEMIQRSPAATTPVVFESINHSTIYHSAMQTRGSGGLSGLNAANFRRMACSTKFKHVSESFCTVSEIVRKLCCELIDRT